VRADSNASDSSWGQRIDESSEQNETTRFGQVRRKTPAPDQIEKRRELDRFQVDL
jgi:hypothetical protein